MEFLVHIAVDLPSDLEDAERDRLTAAERGKGRELLRRGTIVRIWRVGDPSAVTRGHVENVGVWRAGDERALLEALGELPLFPWMTVEVTELRAHPLEGG